MTTAAMQAVHQQEEAAARADAARQQVRDYTEASESAYSEARRVLYADVESFLFQGFLTAEARVLGVHFVFRSLGPGDMFMIRHRVGKWFGARHWKTWVIAHSVWLLDGISMLEHPEIVPRIHAALKNMPHRMLDALYNTVTGLSRRLTRALDRVEAYCYEPYSRNAWRLCEQRSPAREDFTGIPGTNRLGMNHVQQLWTAFNIAEDARDLYQQRWATAKLIASAQSPKGVKRLNAEDERLHDREHNRRQQVLREMVNRVLYGADYSPEAEKMIVVVDGQAIEVDSVVTAKSADQLQDQYERWVAGEKDFHDLIVDKYKSRIRNRFDEEQAEREALIRRELEDEAFDQIAPLVGYTLDELREIRPDLMEPKSRTTRVFDSNKSMHVLQRNVARREMAGAVELGPDGPRTVARDGDPMGEHSDLMDQISRRQPTFRSEPIDTEGGGS